MFYATGAMMDTSTRDTSWNPKTVSMRNTHNSNKRSVSKNITEQNIDDGKVSFLRDIMNKSKTVEKNEKYINIMSLDNINQEISTAMGNNHKMVCLFDEQGPNLGYFVLDFEQIYNTIQEHSNSVINSRYNINEINENYKSFMGGFALFMKQTVKNNTLYFNVLDLLYIYKYLTTTQFTNKPILLLSNMNKKNTNGVLNAKSNL